MKKIMSRILTTTIIIIGILLMLACYPLKSFGLGNTNQSVADGGGGGGTISGGTSSNMDAGGSDFTLGQLDINGGKGISGAPQPYYFGNYYCIDHNTPLTRTKDGTKSAAYLVKETSGQLSETADGETVDYYNQEIDYNCIRTPKTEQSIAAGYYAYKLGAGTVKEFQNVVWASGQWSGGTSGNMPSAQSTNSVTSRAGGNNAPDGYVDNLYAYGNTTASPGSNEDKLYDRAEGWANFYYKVIVPSGGNVNIDVEPKAESDLKIYVDYTARTYSEGPYTMKLLDSNGSDISNTATEHYGLASTVGDLLYREISGINPGCSYFQFAKLKSATATVTFTDGSTEEYSIEILDQNGSKLTFPKFGTNNQFYIRINVPSSETRTVAKFEPHISIDYLTEIPGTTYQYQAISTAYEITDDYFKELTSSTSEEKGWWTGDTITALENAEVTDAESLKNYLTQKIIDAAKEKGYNITKLEEELSLEEVYIQPGFRGDEDKQFTSVKDFEDAVMSNSLIPDDEKEEYISNKKGAEKWHFKFKVRNPVLVETLADNHINEEQGIASITLTGMYSGETIIDIWTWAKKGSAQYDLIGKDCTIEIGGKVWEDVGATKESSLNGRLNTGGADTNDRRYAGMLVELHLGDRNGQIVASTTTDANGGYHFDNLNALEKYTVVFTFNGQLYQQTYYKDNLSGGYSNAKEIDRSGFNNRFDRQDSYSGNYNYQGQWRIAYGDDVRLKDNNGNYISNGQDSDGNNKALTYLDAWNQFVNFARDNKSYSGAYNSLRTWLTNRGVGTTDVNGVIQYIQDSMIIAETRQYPVYEQFIIEDINNPPSSLSSETAMGINWSYLYTQPSDQSRNVDFGINRRDVADLGLQKDVYKATVRVNGKTQTYMYNKKNDGIDENGNWSIEIRQADVLYNGKYKYNREIRKSEYLYDGTIYNITGDNAEGISTSDKDLRVYITYRIAIRNLSATYDTVVNEVVDYFDTSEYVFDGTWNSNTQSYTPNSYSDFEHSNVTSYIGDINGNKIADLVVRRESVVGNSRQGVDTDIGHGYTSTSSDNSKTPLYLSGVSKTIKGDVLTPIEAPVENEKGETVGSNDMLVKNGGMAFIYLTFEVKKHTVDNPDENGMTDRIQMDVNVADGSLKGFGKQNIAEINSYSTYYGANETVPDRLNDNDTVVNLGVTGEKGGAIDVNSTPGNLTSQDLTNEGELNITNDPLTNRVENDTDKAPNIRLVFPTTDDDERTAVGYVYEDNRNVESGKAMVGDGRYNDGETKINGVTVQLVELIQIVDKDGIPIQDDNGNYQYAGEYVWNAKTWNGTDWVDTNSSTESGSIRYYSGQGLTDSYNSIANTVAPIFSGPGVTAISGYTFTGDATGKYAFKAMPTGDMIIRFIYGDTTQTTLTTADGEGAEVVDLLQSQNSTPDNQGGYISNSGLNAKSYNGQDYKSTTYQTGVDQSGAGVGVFNDIYGYGYEYRYNEETQSGEIVLDTDNYNTQNYNITRSAQTGAGVINDIDGRDKTNNYYYNIGVSQPNDQNNTTGISDAKDVLNIRTDSNNYAKGITNIDSEDEQTLVNGRAEVLASGLKVASTDELQQGAVTRAEKQIAMIKELMNNTLGIAQTGVINTEVEKNTAITTNQGESNNMGYLLDDIDLGLEERPIAQLKLNKEVTNVRIQLQDGTLLFDSNRPVTNMSYSDHPGHKINYNPADPNGKPYRLESVQIAQELTNMPELITTYMDEELMFGATIIADYEITVTNVGEVDYLDNQFYYTGVSNNYDAGNVSTTAANTIIDYVTNNIVFYQELAENSNWKLRTVADLTTERAPDTDDDYNANPVGNSTNLVNSKYYQTLNTYQRIITTKALSTPLYPEAAEFADKLSSLSTSLRLSVDLSTDAGDDTMVYNNLTEIVQITNSQGRRMKFAIPGNQPMADQEKIPDDTPTIEEDGIYKKTDIVKPTEIDADSSQEILILPPTGANRNYTLWIIVGVVALIVLAGGVFLIRRFLKKQ